MKICELFNMVVTENFQGSIDNIPVEKLAKTFVSRLRETTGYPSYYNELPIEYWEHKIKTNEIIFMD